VKTTAGLGVRLKAQETCRCSASFKHRSSRPLTRIVLVGPRAADFSSSSLTNSAKHKYYYFEQASSKGAFHTGLVINTQGESQRNFYY